MHTRLLKGLTLSLLIAVLAACSGVDAPAADTELATLQDNPFSGEEVSSRFFRVFGGSAVELKNGVCFFKDLGFGPFGLFEPGPPALCFRAEDSDSVPVGVRFGFNIRPSWNDEISSLIVAPGYQVITYTDSNFRGRGARAGAANGFARVGQVQFNNAISSFEIARTD